MRTVQGAPVPAKRKPRPPRRAAYDAPWWTLGVWFLVAGIVYHLRSGPSTDFRHQGEVMAQAIGMGFIPYLIASLVGYFSRGAGTAVFVVTLVAAVPFVLRDLPAQRAEAEQLARANEARRSHVAAISAKVKAAYEAEVQRVMAEFHRASAAYVHPLDDLERSRSRADLETRKELTLRLRRANAALMELQAHPEPFLTKALADAGAEAADSAGFLEAFRSASATRVDVAAKRELSLERRRRDEAALGDAIALLDLLSSRFGQWHTEPRLGVRFRSPKDQATFKRLVENIERLTAEDPSAPAAQVE